MDVRELNRDQLSQLKMELYYMDVEDLVERFKGSITKEILEEIYNANIWEDISDETTYTLYEGISFVEEDFFNVRVEN